MHYLARLLAEPGREFHVMDLVALESGGNVPVGGPNPSCSPRSWETPARCSMREPRRRTVDVSRRSRRTSRRRGRWGTPGGPRRPVRRTRLPRSRALPRGRARWPRSKSRICVRARSGERDPGRPPGDDANPSAPSAAGKAPGPRHPHRHVLRVPAGPAGALDLDAVTRGRARDRGNQTAYCVHDGGSARPPGGSTRKSLHRQSFRHLRGPTWKGAPQANPDLQR